MRSMRKSRAASAAPRYCRRIKSVFEKDTADLCGREMRNIEVQIGRLSFKTAPHFAALRVASNMHNLEKKTGVSQIARANACYLYLLDISLP